MKTYITDGLFENITQRSYVWGKNYKKINNSHEMQNELNDKYRKGVNRRETIKVCYANTIQEVRKNEGVNSNRENVSLRKLLLIKDIVA